MTILFDIFILLPGWEQDLKPNERVIFNEIISFFEQRLNLLKDEIERQEAANPKGDSCTMIHFLPPESQWTLPKEQQDQKIKISSHGYTPELKKKMEESFNNNDFILLNQKLEALNGMWNN